VIKDTTYSHHVLLQRIDEKMALLAIEEDKDTHATIELKDEKLVIKQCLRICEDASGYIETLITQHQNTLECAAELENEYEAQLLTRNTLSSHHAGLLDVIGHLKKRLETLIRNETPTSDPERERLQKDIEISRQCLEVCNLASGEVTKQKKVTVGEAIAAGDSDQVVINTLADLFDVRKAVSKDNSAQLIASVNEETLQQLFRARYSSRFGAVTGGQTNNSSSHPPRTSNDVQMPTRQEPKHTEQKKSSPNEVRKRTGESSGRKQQQTRDIDE
jgi:hypothetical protein